MQWHLHSMSSGVCQICRLDPAWWRDGTSNPVAQRWAEVRFLLAGVTMHISATLLLTPEARHTRFPTPVEMSVLRFMQCCSPTIMQKYGMPLLLSRPSCSSGAGGHATADVMSR